MEFDPTFFPSKSFVISLLCPPPNLRFPFFVSISPLSPAAIVPTWGPGDLWGMLWSTGNLSVVLPSEGACSLSSSSHPWSLAPHSRAGPGEGTCPLCRNLAALVLNRSRAGNHSCLEFMRATVPSWSEVRISHHSFPSSDSPFPLLSPFQCSPNLNG